MRYMTISFRKQNTIDENELDDLFDNAVKIVTQYDRASASLIQRRLGIGYARAARIIDQLEAARVIGPPNGSQPNDVLIQSYEEFLEKSGKLQCADCEVEQLF
jgi:S-DNA-T family DNA segregation ATPase FtsK/SpoIIIE